MRSTTFRMGGDPSVRRRGFGAMRLPTEPGPAREASLQVARRAVELGTTLIATAHMYGWGANEELLAEALYPTRTGCSSRPRSASRDRLPRASGDSTGGLMPSAVRSNMPCVDCVSSGLSCSSCTASILRYPSPTSSGCCGSSRPRARSAGSDCPRSRLPS